MTVVYFALAILLLGIAAVAWWLVVTPFVVEGEIEGGTGTGFRLETSVGFGPVLAKILKTSGVEGRLVVFLFGRKIRDEELVSGPPREPRPPPEKKKTGGAGALETVRRIDRWWGIDELLLFAFRSSRYFRFHKLAGWLRYSCEDPALTGEIFGYWCAARELLRPVNELEVVPEWKMEDGFSGSVRVGAEFFLFRLLLALAGFLAVQFVRRRTALLAAGRERTGPVVR